MNKEKLPNKKVAATGISGGVSVIVIWIIGLFGIIVPPEIAAAFTVVVGGLVGYWTPERINEAVDVIKGDSS